MMKWLGCGVLIAALWVSANVGANAQTIVPCAAGTIEPSCRIPPYQPANPARWGSLFGDLGAVPDTRTWYQIVWDFWF